MAPSTSYTEAVADAVQYAIDTGGTTVNAVAKATGIPQATLHRRLNGSPETFLIRELDKIANHLGIPVEQLSAPKRDAA